VCVFRFFLAHVHSNHSLLERIGLEFQLMNEGGQPGGLGGFGGLFNMVGNPGDYVFGQGGLDDVITQMMELQRYTLASVLRCVDVLIDHVVLI
jgi:hypothetical protein